MSDKGPYIGDPPQLGTEAKGYALSGKIMLSAIVILFVVVLFMVALHIYARWYLLRVRHRNLHNRRNRRQRSAHIVFYVDTNSSTLTVPAGGLNASVISSLPVFAYSSLTHATALECAVCLSEFEENEKGRLLPKCQHCFHIDCIDMWFQSHSTCPLCRSPVDSVQAPTNNQNDVVLSIGEPGGTDPGSGSGLGSECEQSGSTSVADRRKDLETVDESRINSPAAQGFRSPGTRMLSLKRILSMNRKVPAASASGGTGTSSDSEVTESQLGGGSGRVDSVSNSGSYSSVENGERYRHSGTVSHTI